MKQGYKLKRNVKKTRDTFVNHKAFKLLFLYKHKAVL